MNKTMVSFKLTLKYSKEEFLKGYLYEDRVGHYQELRKPGTMESNVFLPKLRKTNWMFRDIPGALVYNTGFTNAQMQHIYHIGYSSTISTFSKHAFI